MAKDKRSFFERLTGSVNVEEEEMEAEERSVPASGKHTRVDISSAQTNDAWSGEEAEGQLTVDVHQTASDIIIKTMVAGVKPDDLEINITRDMVTIRGRRELTKEVSEDDYFFRELYWGAFSRTILLPQEIEPDNAEATEKFGLLTIRLPKIDKGRQTKLKVKSGN